MTLTTHHRDDLTRPIAPGVVLRRAVAGDLPMILLLLRDDVLGRHREAGDQADYQEAFLAVDADPAHDLVVLVDTQTAEVIGTMQLTVIHGLGRKGVPRAQIESVRVAADRRGQGLGEAFMRWALKRARHRGCGLVQLTSDQQRPDAHRFYERLGMAPSHTGFKLTL